VQKYRHLYCSFYSDLERDSLVAVASLHTHYIIVVALAFVQYRLDILCLLDGLTHTLVYEFVEEHCCEASQEGEAHVHVEADEGIGVTVKELLENCAQGYSRVQWCDILIRPTHHQHGG
jgi:hypothetical protein